MKGQPLTRLEMQLWLDRPSAAEAPARQGVFDSHEYHRDEMIRLLTESLMLTEDRDVWKQRAETAEVRCADYRQQLFDLTDKEP
jgi:hypothetical protein